MTVILREPRSFNSLGDMFAFRRGRTITRSPKEQVTFQKQIYSLFGKGTIAYQPDIAKKLKSVKGAVFLAQLLFWHDKGWKKGWVYKTVREFYEETGLKRKEQETAIKLLKKHKILTVKVEGIPPIRHFQIDLEAVRKLSEIIPKVTREQDIVLPQDE